MVLLFNGLMPDRHDYAEVIAPIVALLATGDRAGAERSMADIAYARRTISKRPAIPRPLMIQVFRRDCWTCRYCGQRVIFYPMMPLLGSSSPSASLTTRTGRRGRPTPPSPHAAQSSTT